MKSSFRIASIVLALGLAGAAQAAPVNVFVGTVAAGSEVTTFQTVTGGPFPGANYDAALSIGNVGFAERFVGQTVGSNGLYDTLAGAPGGTLTLAPGAPNANLAVVAFTTGNNVLAGLGSALFPNNNALGFGAIAALFSSEQSEVGFDVVGSNSGTATVSFFRRNGSLIDSVILSSLTDTSFTFRRDGNALDIAGFSITHTDPGGMGYDNFRFDPTPNPQPAPEPGSLALVGVALLGAYGVRRRVLG